MSIFNHFITNPRKGSSPLNCRVAQIPTDHKDWNVDETIDTMFAPSTLLRLNEKHMTTVDEHTVLKVRLLSLNFGMNPESPRGRLKQLTIKDERFIL